MFGLYFSSTMRRVIVLLIFLLPLLFFVIIGEEGLGVSPLLVLVILLGLFFAAGFFVRGGCEDEESEHVQEKDQPSDDHIHSLWNELQPFLSVSGLKAADGIVQFEGSLRTDPTDAISGI